MADFGKFKITDVGIELEYKAQTGKELKFSKFVLGDGYYTGDIKELTNIINPIMNAEIKRLNIQTLTENKKVSIGFNLNTAEITTGFYLREIGLFAKDPDTNEDILVFYGNAGDTADYISPNTSTTISEKLVDLELYISNVDNITAVIDSSLTYATLQDFETFKSNITGYAPTAKEVKLLTTDWNYNNTTKYYEYIINDTTITRHDIATGAMDIENQKKLIDGYINTYDDYLVIYTTTLPTSNIDITITVWKTTDVVDPDMSEQEITDLINDYF